eukprot:1825710-Alexandrium_andersonii.AAC.1
MPSLDVQWAGVLMVESLTICAPHPVVAKHSASKGETYYESQPRRDGLAHGGFVGAAGGDSRGYGIPPITVFWGCNELVASEGGKTWPQQ